MRRLVLGIAAAISSLAPAAVQADDQQIADFIRGKLQIEQQQGNLKGFNVDMKVDRGTVWFDGHAANHEQEMLILRTAQQAGHLGVVQVVDDIELSESRLQAPQMNKQASVQSMVKQRPQDAQRVQFEQPKTPLAFQQTAYERPLARAATAPETSAPAFRQASAQEYISDQGYVSDPVVMDQGYGTAYPSDGMSGAIISSGEPMAFAACGGGSCGAPMGGAPMMGAPMGGAPMMGGQAPMSAGFAGGGAGGPGGAPNLPGYAWPGYAAHPNAGALTYPKQYSAAAWPYIGPFYPYPQVPLGWRKVSLEWDDGWWQIDFHDK